MSDSLRGALRSYCGQLGIDASYVADLLEWLDGERCALLAAALSCGNYESILSAYDAELKGLQAGNARRLAKKGVKKGRKAKIDKCDCLEKFLEAKKSTPAGKPEPWPVFQGEDRLEDCWAKRTESSLKPNEDRRGYKSRRRSKGRVIWADGVLVA